MVDKQSFSVIWYRIHNLARSIDIGILDEKEFIILWRDLIERKELPCETCRVHAVDFINKNPIEQGVDVKNTYLRWTWNFHNAVNKMLGREAFDWDKCLSIYEKISKNIEPCNIGCKSDILTKEELNYENLKMRKRGSHINNFYPPL